MGKYYKKPMKVTTSKRLEARENALGFDLNLVGLNLIIWHIFLLDQSCTAKKRKSKPILNCSGHCEVVLS